MKNTILFLVLFIFSIGNSQEIKEGSYYALFSLTNHSVSKTENRIHINTCQNISKENASFTSYLDYHLLDDGKHYWNGEKNPKIALNYETEKNYLYTSNPTSFSEEFYFYLMQEKGEKPASFVKSYLDETIGGYSSARYLVEDKTDLANQDCLIHTAQTDQYNSFVVGNYIEEPMGIRVTLNGDFTGLLNDLPITWSYVSNAQGKPLAVDNEDVTYLCIMVEYVNETPIWIDPAPGKKVGQAFPYKYFKKENQLIFGGGAGAMKQ
ncbi:hypothetical protein [Moheibacter sp.]|uniref:hypothetical protein n=1 Tax=Moheibacter sp. TaxID=1965316 RepID=UPI003C76A04D